MPKMSTPCTSRRVARKATAGPATEGPAEAFVRHALGNRHTETHGEKCLHDGAPIRVLTDIAIQEAKDEMMVDWQVKVTGEKHST